jgi:hypothetical protein
MPPKNMSINSPGRDYIDFSPQTPRPMAATPDSPAKNRPEFFELRNLG